MNRDKRHFVHEYCEHFGCESVAYDQEPKRNVVATAARDKVITRETVRIFIILKIK
jgi:transcriptional repressor NF-X1